MIRLTVILLFASFLFSSCIEIEEKIVIHSDQSGSVSYSLITSEVGSLLFGISGLLGISVDDQVKSETEHLIRQLFGQPGIENIQYNLTHSYGRYFVSFDFRDASSFNNAIYKIGGQKKTVFSPGYIKISPTRFRKLNFSPYLDAYLKKEKREINEVLRSNVLIFRSEIVFPDNIRKTNKKEIILSANQTQVTQKFKFRDILDNKVNTGIKVKY